MKNYEDLFLSLGKETFEDLKKTIDIVENQSRILSIHIKKILNLKQSEEYLKTIYVPFLAHFFQANKLKNLNKNNEIIFQNFSEFYIQIFGEVFYGKSKAFEKDLNFEKGQYDLTITSPINKYEKLVYFLKGINYHEIKYKEYQKAKIIKPDENKRKKLKDFLDNNKILFEDNKIIDWLPCTLFEGLIEQKDTLNYPTAKVHWLGQIHNEYYLFYLAYLKENKTKIIGQTHGGGFSQTQYLFGNEIAEMILSDEHHSPKWNSISKVFPNIRASRNLFINLRYFFKRKKNKLIVITSYFIPDDHIVNLMFLDKETNHNEFYHSQLRNLNKYFNLSIDFKTHPLENDIVVKCDYLKILYPGCQFISNISVQEIAHEYSGVIHMDAWNTALIELAGTNIKQYAYLGQEIKLNEGYKNFLLDNNKINLKINPYIEINNKKYRSAYGASFLYPFMYSKLIKKLIN
jgi:hypothetical protein